ncbi:MAG: glycosyltransferase, partial [bacterium]
MKVLLMVPELNVGGVETHVLSLAGGMARAGREVVVVSNGGAMVPTLEATGAEHVSLPIHRKSPLTIREMSARVAEIIRERDIDIVHAHSRVPAWISYFAVRRMRSSLVLSAHGQYTPHMGSRVMAYGDRIICVSRVIRDHLVQKLGAPPLKTTIVYNGIDLRQVEKAVAGAKTPAEMKAELGLPGGAPLVGLI